MQLSNIPAKFNIPFADSAGGSFIRNIPQSPSGTPGQASLQTGFPPENFEPVAGGGVPPFGADFNGLLNQSTAWNRWQGAGVAFPPYDATFQAAIGGYPKSALVASLIEPLLVYYSLVDNNVTNPDNGGAGWFIWFRRLITNTTIYVNGATGNDANNGLSPATPLATVQAALNLAWTWPPSSFTLTIMIANGTYAAAVTPVYPGPSISIIGNVGSPTSVVINGGTANSALTVRGPNTMSVQGVCVQTGNSSTTTLSGFVAQSGATMTVANTASNAVQGGVFEALSGSTLAINGPHTFLGNSQSLFWGSFAGTVILTPSASYTIGGAITLSIGSAFANTGGSVTAPTPRATFTNPGNVTGPRYSAISNGIIDTQAAGATYFPGTIAGSTTTGGQYV